MKVRREAAQAGMDTRRAKGGFRRRTRQYVEESDRAQRGRHARIRRRSRSFMNNAGEDPAFDSFSKLETGNLKLKEVANHNCQTNTGPCQ